MFKKYYRKINCTLFRLISLVINKRVMNKVPLNGIRQMVIPNEYILF
jgi:hypothetical protein